MNESSALTNLENVANSIEKTYEELHSVINQISDLSDTISDLKKNSKDVRERYAEVLDNTKLNEVQKDYKNSVKSMEKSLDKIQDGILSIQTIRQMTQDNLEGIIKKMGHFETLLNTYNAKSKNFEKKLNTSLETLKLNHNNVTKKADQAIKAVELNHQMDKYDEIITLQKQNYDMLKKLTSKPNHNPKKQPSPKRTNSYSGKSEK